jgi:hypothetical protein
MNAGYIYVLVFGNGTVKIGRTQNPKRRMWALKSEARKYGTVVAGSWVSPLHVEWELNEDTLKVIATRHGGTPVSPEYFNGADYPAIVTAATTRLPFTRPSAETADGAGPECLKHPDGMTVRQCAIRATALEIRARETADADRMEWWKRFRSAVACNRCEAAA